MVKNAIIFSIIFLLSCSCRESVSSDSVLAKPNIVFILADDLGIPQVGAYGSEYYETPSIDKLAQNGVLFNQAYSAAAICSPTRAALMTGKHPARLKITDFISGNKNDTFPLSQPSWQKWLPLDEVTVGEVFKQNGYATALFGKWHLSKGKLAPESLTHNPDKQGFDETFLTLKPASYLPTQPWQTAEQDAHNVDTLTNLAIDFINRKQDASFFLILSHNAIHDPIMEKEAVIREFEAKDSLNGQTNNAVWAAMMRRMDDGIGRINQSLEDLGLLDNTIVIFYSDNGAKHDYAQQTPFRKGKGWLYEGGIRVPLIMQWKGKIEPRSKFNEPVNTMDLLPTLAGLCQLETEVLTEDGLDISPFLLEGANLTARDMYWHYPHYHRGSGMKPASAIRSGDYKLIQWHEETMLNKKGAIELYNLAEDMGERNNLSGELPQKVEELKLKLDHWKLNLNAQDPTINSKL